VSEEIAASFMSTHAYLQRKWTRRVGRFMDSLSLESEFIGLLGKDYPRSFYKVFVRPAKGKPWWKVESDVWTVKGRPYPPLPRDSMADFFIPAGGLVCGPLRWLPTFEFYNFQHQNALPYLFARAHALVAEERGSTE
jgi:hypothetical protein